jgi:iron transport multicopper oxidase
MFPAEALHVPSYFNPYGVATLEYGEDFPLFQSSDPDPDFSTFDDLLFKPLEIADPFPADQEIRLDGSFALYNDSVNHGSFNSTPYEKPLVPSLLTVLTTGANATNASTYGKYTGTSILEHNKGIQLILINKGINSKCQYLYLLKMLDTEGPHPFHLHGHVFQILARGQLLATSETFPLKYRFDYSVLPLLESVTNPVRRDTVTVPATGYVILRFIADNPGVWFFHWYV